MSIYYLSVDMPDFEHYGKLCTWSLEKSLFPSFLVLCSRSKTFVSKIGQCYHFILCYVFVIFVLLLL